MCLQAFSFHCEKDDHHVVLSSMVIAGCKLEQSHRRCLVLEMGSSQGHVRCRIHCTHILDPQHFEVYRRVGYGIRSSFSRRTSISIKAIITRILLRIIKPPNLTPTNLSLHRLAIVYVSESFLCYFHSLV